MTTVAVVGGGAAGFFTAITLAEKAPTVKIILIEATDRPLQKVRISGGGRCNVTHACFDPKALVAHYPRGEKELRSLFHRFAPQEMVAWLAERGLPLKTEEDGRMFPVTDSSETLIDLFVALARKRGVVLHYRQRIHHIQRKENGFEILTNTALHQVDAVVLATGYSPTGWAIAQSLGHSLLKPVPSLFPLKVAHPVIEGLQGITLNSVGGKLKTEALAKPIEARGAMLVTHTGLSGPLIYRLSAWGARPLAEANYQATLYLDLVPEVSREQLKALMDELTTTEWAERKISNTKLPVIPYRLWQALLGVVEAPMEERGLVLGDKRKNRLVELIKRLELPVSGKSPSKEEFVSCGGVPRNEIDFARMESRVCPGLYFAGEIVDIDGLTGGFNFQACWSEAWSVSEALAAKWQQPNAAVPASMPSPL